MLLLLPSSFSIYYRFTRQLSLLRRNLRRNSSTMLCSECKRIFTFSLPDFVEKCIRNKQNGIDYAIENGWDESHIAIMRNDLARYQQQQDDVQTHNAFPCPWPTGGFPREDFPSPIFLDFVYLEQPHHMRTWEDWQSSVSRTNCPLCETLIAMVQYVTKRAGPESAIKIISSWAVNRGSCEPWKIKFLVFIDNLYCIWLDFNVIIADDKAGEFTIRNEMLQT